MTDVPGKYDDEISLRDIVAVLKKLRLFISQSVGKLEEHSGGGIFPHTASRAGAVRMNFLRSFVLLFGPHDLDAELDRA